MISFESIMSIDKSDMLEASKTVIKDDIPQLVDWLSLKDDNIRYQAYLLMQNRSVSFDDGGIIEVPVFSRQPSDNSLWIMRIL